MIDCCVVFFFFKQKTAYEMRISDWSSDVCSSDLCGDDELGVIRPQMARDPAGGGGLVIKTFVKADGESLDRLCRLGLHHGDDQRGIDAAGKEIGRAHV